MCHARDFNMAKRGATFCGVLRRFAELLALAVLEFGLLSQTNHFGRQHTPRRASFEHHDLAPLSHPVKSVV